MGVIGTLPSLYFGNIKGGVYMEGMDSAKAKEPTRGEKAVKVSVGKVGSAAGDASRKCPIGLGDEQGVHPQKCPMERGKG